MELALRYFDFYDLMDRGQVADGETARRYGSDYLPIDNVDTSEPVLALGPVYTEILIKENVTIMSAFRKDLFVTITLPVLLAALGSVALGLTAYTHIDTKLDAAKAEASSGLDHLGDTLRQELRADREARAKEFETIRSEMREDRKDMRDTIKALSDRP